jgi:hypothetical protein
MCTSYTCILCKVVPISSFGIERQNNPISITPAVWFGQVKKRLKNFDAAVINPNFKTQK